MLIDAGNPQAWGYLFLQITVGYVMIVAALVISDVFILHKFDNVAMMAQVGGGRGRGGEEEEELVVVVAWWWWKESV